MSAHTPGPWFSDSKGCVWRRHPRDLYENGGGVAGDEPIATCHRGWHGENETWYPLKANARLMAAAPELKAIAEDFEITGPDGDGFVWLVLHGNGNKPKAMFNLGQQDRLAAQVALKLEEDRRSAIAKARGGAA